MADISERINGLPPALREAIDFMQAGNLVECLHSILRAGDEINEQKLHQTISRRDLLQLEEEYDRMHTALNSDIFELKTQLDESERAKKAYASELEIALDEAHKRTTSVDLLQKRINELESDESACQRALLAANAELVEAQHQNEEMEMKISTLNAQNKDLASSALRISARPRSDLGQSHAAQSPVGTDFALEGGESAALGDSARVFYANPVQVMPQSRPEDSFIHIQAFDAEAQTEVYSEACATQCDIDETGKSVAGTPFKANDVIQKTQEDEIEATHEILTMRIPTSYSKAELMQVVSLLQEQNFDLRNLLLQQYTTDNSDKIEAFMQLDKAEAIIFLLTQNENLMGILESADVGSFIASREANTECVRLRQELEYYQEELAIEHQKLLILEQIKVIPKDRQKVAFFKTLCEIYEDIFAKGVRVQVAHLCSKEVVKQHEEDAGRTTLLAEAHAIETAITAPESFERNAKDILLLLLKAARNPANEAFLNTELALANEQTKVLKEQITQQNKVITELREFTLVLGDHLEGKITTLQRLSQAAFDSAKISEMEKLTSEENDVILGLRRVLRDLERPVTCDIEIEAYDPEYDALREENEGLESQISVVQKTNVRLTEKLASLVENVQLSEQRQHLSYAEIRKLADDTDQQFKPLLTLFAEKMERLSSTTQRISDVDLGVSALSSRIGRLQEKMQYLETALKEYTQVLERDMEVETEFVISIDRDVQNTEDTDERSAQTNEEAEHTDFSHQHDSVCNSCEMARDVYDTIRVQNSELQGRIAQMRTDMRNTLSENEALKSDLELAGQRADAAIKQYKLQLKLTTREKIEAKQHRKRSLELAEDKEGLLQSNKELTEKNEHLNSQIVAQSKNRDQMRQELEALTDAYSAIVEQAKTSKERAAQLVRQLESVKEELHSNKSECKDALASCKEYEEQLGKSLEDVERWRQRYIQLRQRIPKREVDEEKKSALESILSSDDIQSIYEW